jgi:ADP-heptose:LPS heptosyltransferase
MPRAKVVLFIEKGSSCLIPFLEGPDEVVSISSERNKYFEIAKLAWRLRAEKFDLAISAKTTPMKLMNASLVAIGAKHRAAYVDRSWHSRLINHPRTHSKEVKIHQALRAIHLIDPEMEELPKRLFPTLKLPKKTRLFSQRTLLISASNNRVGCTLPPEETAELLNALALKIPFAVAVSALTKDISKAWKIASLLKMEKGIFDTGNFDEFMALLNSADAVFVGDGGIGHLAAGLQKPSVLLYGGTKVWEWGPMSQKAIVLSHPHHVVDISREEIFKALEETLSTL